MDIYFKMHHVFKIPYNKALVQFMNFFEKYVYEMNLGTSVLTPQSKKQANVIYANTPNA